MARIYTRGGDGGTTGVGGGGRVPKDDARIEAVGTLDELNCALGTIRALLPRGGDVVLCYENVEYQKFTAGNLRSERDEREVSVGCDERGVSYGYAEHDGTVERDERDGWLHRIQCEMMTAMSLVATPAARRDGNPRVLDPHLTEWCEVLIDSLMARCADRDMFVLPGGTPLAAAMHTARAIARRAERRLWTLHRADPLPEEVLRFVNRLSDLLFALAREEMVRTGEAEDLWRPFNRKRAAK